MDICFIHPRLLNFVGTNRNISMQPEKQYFQDHMPGNVCFGCGTENTDGLHIKSYWDGDVSKCDWDSSEKYRGWPGLMNGGIMASLVDCHCMGTAMADAMREEGRALGSEPEYRYATGTLSIKYLKPTSNTTPVQLVARVTERKGRKTVLHCEIWSKGVMTAEAEVVAIRVFDSSKESDGAFG